MSEVGSELTRQLLGFAWGGKYEVTPSDLGEIVAKSTEMFGRTRKDIRIDIERTPDLVPVDIDRGQIDLVFLNIRLNAGGAMAVCQGIRFRHGHRHGRKDKGAHLRSIFQHQGHRQGHRPGHGLRLWNYKKPWRDHQRIQRTGSRIHFYGLPARLLEECAPGSGGPGQPFGGLTILVVDDEEMVLDTTSRMLTRAGCSVLTAAGGKQALDIYRDNRDVIDLVILDMIMPAVGGGEVFDRIRQVESSGTGHSIQRLQHQRSGQPYP